MVSSVVIYFTNNVRPEIISSYRDGESVNGVKAVFLSNAGAIVVRIEARSGLKDRAWKLRACFGQERPIQRATLFDVGPMCVVKLVKLAHRN